MPRRSRVVAGGGALGSQRPFVPLLSGEDLDVAANHAWMLAHTATPEGLERVRAAQEREPHLDINIAPVLQKAVGEGAGVDSGRHAAGASSATSSTARPDAEARGEEGQGAGAGGRAPGRKGNQRPYQHHGHPSTRHLNGCEGRHCWRWIPDERLSRLWHELTPEEREGLVLQTHGEDHRPTAQFVKEMHALMKPRECRASEASKMGLAAVILHDQQALSIYKDIFAAAVAEDAVLAIDMDVIDAVDGVVQDLCVARGLSGPDSSFSDPRTFPEGSALWVQHCEREHVRLMWMSALAQLFERRLLEIWEERHGAEEMEAAERASMQAAMELLQEEEQQQGAGSKRSKKKKAPGKGKRPGGETAQQEAAEELRDAENRIRQRVADRSSGGGDEIDAEFDRRVLEHLRKRAEAAKENPDCMQAERGNMILKALCEKLKVQLEQHLR